MIPTVIVDPNLQTRTEAILDFLAQKKLSKTHPEMLWISEEERLGIKEVKKITEHFKLKSSSKYGPAIVFVKAEELTMEAQNSLLKTLEEPPENAVIILGVSSEEDLLPTILSRCHVLNLNPTLKRELLKKDIEEIEKLTSLSIEERFLFIEKLKDKDEFFLNLIFFYRSKFYKNPNKDNLAFLKEISLMEKYWKSNVNQRAILEYLLLLLPKS